MHVSGVRSGLVQSTSFLPVERLFPDRFDPLADVLMRKKRFSDQSVSVCVFLKRCGRVWDWFRAKIGAARFYRASPTDRIPKSIGMFLETIENALVQSSSVYAGLGHIVRYYSGLT